MLKLIEEMEVSCEQDAAKTELLQPPKGLSPLEHALWTLSVFSRQVAAFTDDAERLLTVAAMNQQEQPAQPKLTRRKRGERRLRGGYRHAG